MYKMKNDNFDVKIYKMPVTTQNFFKKTNSNQASSINDISSNDENTKRNNRVQSAMISLNSFSQQSPKLKPGKLRETNELDRNKIFKPNDFSPSFSLLDVPDKKIAKGTSLPIQYKKLTPEEIDGLYTTERMKEYKKKSSFENPQKFDNNFEENKFFRGFPSIDRQNKKFDTLEERKIPELKSELNKARIMERKIKTAKPTETKLNLLRKIELENINNNVLDTPNDVLLPVNYREQERKIRTAHTQRLTQHNSKDIKKRMCDSNIFSTKILPMNNEQNEKIRVENWGFNTSSVPMRDYRSSDIFMIKNNRNSKQAKGVIYNVSSLSNSEWHDKVSQPSLLNHTSVNYHILNPDIKHIFKTKEEISDKNVMSLNPSHRQKSLCEYRDLTRVGQPNVNKGYQVAYNKSPNVFNRNSDICANYLDLHRGYKNLVDPPFGK